MSVVGGVSGIVVGAVATELIAAVAKWPTIISPVAIAGGFLFSAVVGIFFGYYPARKAARLNPIEALRHGDSGCGSCAVALSVLLAGCALGPDYARPPPPNADRFTADDPQVIRSAPALPEQVVRRESTVPARWWTLFGSPELDAVVDRTLAGSPTLASARAALARAEHDLAATRGAKLPQVSVSATAQRGKPDTSSAVSNGFMAEPTAVWNADVFGGNRRHVEQSSALVDYARAQRQAARVALVGSAVLQVIAIASIEEQIAATQDILAAHEENLALVQVSAEAGKSARLDV